jgi:conjugal transfer pilus assembly protein TraV
VAPWEDADGDLHEESIVHLVVHTGRWLIDHVRPNPRSAIDGVTPPPASNPATPAPQDRDALSPSGLPLSPGIDGVSRRTDPEER